LEELYVPKLIQWDSLATRNLATKFLLLHFIFLSVCICINLTLMIIVNIIILHILSSYNLFIIVITQLYNS